LWFPPSTYNTTMPSPRKSLAQRLNPNRKPRGSLSRDERLSIINRVLGGEKISVLASWYQCHQNIIQNTIKWFHETNNLRNRPQPGQPPRLNQRKKRSLLRLVCKEPAIPWASLIEWYKTRLGKKVSKTMLWRILRSTNLRHWKSLKRIFLDRRAILQRTWYYRYWQGKEEELTRVYITKIRLFRG